MSDTQRITDSYQGQEEPAPDLMVIFIDDLDGNEVQFDLSEVGAVYPSDDVIYISGVACRLSSARPNSRIHPFDCPRCGPRKQSQVRQEERDEVCLYVCADCGEVITETMPF